MHDEQVSNTMRYRSVILDVDSTLCAIEGIDWLAAQRGPEVAARIACARQHDRALRSCRECGTEDIPAP